MPKAKTKPSGLCDTWGRKNRTLEDKTCPVCGKSFRPIRKQSKYCSRPCMWTMNGGHNKKAESWWINSRGYVEGKIWIDENTQIQIKKHRFVMEGILGRPLKPSEDVHHKDGNRANNNPSNLELIDHSAHAKLSNKGRIHKTGYKLNLSSEERQARSLRAIAQQLSKLGRAAIAQAQGGAQ